MRIGFRTIKTAVGTSLTVFLMQMIGIQFFISGGMLTILCMQSTRRKSLEIAFARFGACLVAIIVSSVLFTIFGQNVLVIGLILLVVIPITVRFKIAGGIGTSSVVMLQMYNAPVIDFVLIKSLFILVVIGIGVALAVNFYMPSVDKELEGYQKQVEKQFQSLFHRMAEAIRGEDVQGTTAEIRKVEKNIKSGRKLSVRELQNYLLHPDDTYYQYFSAKEKQLDVIKRVEPIIEIISSTHKQNYIIADFLDSIADAMRPESTETITLLQLQEMRQQFRQLPLPKTMEEFENRAYLMQFVYEMEQYLLIKRAYIGYDEKPAFYGK